MTAMTDDVSADSSDELKTTGKCLADASVLGLSDKGVTFASLVSEEHFRPLLE
jgi:hypothetical protein